MGKALTGSERGVGVKKRLKPLGELLYGEDHRLRLVVREDVVPDADVRRKVRRELEALGFSLSEMASRHTFTCLAARTSGALRRAERELGRLAEDVALEHA